MEKGLLDYTRTPDMAEEESAAQVALVLAVTMERRGVNLSWLAAQTGLSEKRISQILDADGDPTIRILARLGQALNCRLSVDFV